MCIFIWLRLEVSFFCDMVKMVCMMMWLILVPFSQWSHSSTSTILWTKSVSLPLSKLHMKAPEAGHMCSFYQFQTPTNTSQLPLSTGISLFFAHYYFTFLPLSALTCLSCDGTQAFFRNCWYSDGLGEPDHLISYLLFLLLKSPPAFTFPLCSTHFLH